MSIANPPSAGRLALCLSRYLLKLQRSGYSSMMTCSATMAMVATAAGHLRRWYRSGSSALFCEHRSLWPHMAKVGAYLRGRDHRANQVL